MFLSSGSGVIDNGSSRVPAACPFLEALADGRTLPYLAVVAPRVSQMRPCCGGRSRLSRRRSVMTFR
jgi:hypothetical protein